MIARARERGDYGVRHPAHFIRSCPLPRHIHLLLATLLCAACDTARPLAPPLVRHVATRQVDSMSLARLRAVQSRREMLLSAHSIGGRMASVGDGQRRATKARAFSCDALNDEIDALDRRYDQALAGLPAPASVAHPTEMEVIGTLEHLTSAVERLDSLYHLQRCPD